MIDCPICHVKNDNDARFCAECGQRLAGQPQQQEQPQQEQPPQAPPRPQAPPQVPPQQLPSQPTGPRLHSPLLAGGGGDIGGPGPGPEPQRDAAEVNRLRQMASKQGDKPMAGPMDSTPYKNPYDPRNTLPPEQTQQQQVPLPGEQPRRKGGLRSPLLAGEEFDDEEEQYEQQQQSAPTQGRGLRSPLLSGGEGGGGGGLRSPLLGGGGGSGADYEEDYDQQVQSSGGLRSPLLGGGGGGYSGTDRRRPPDQIDPYGGTERRGSGLRSPILGGGGGDWQDDYYDDEEDPYGEEDNPNMLRSPLLSAKRPVSDRPQVKAPANSSIHDPRAAALPPEPSPQVHYPQGSPSSSYNSLRTISSVSPKPAQPQPMTPPAPNQQPGFGQSQRESGAHGFNQMAQSGPQSFGQAGGFNQQQQSGPQPAFGQPSAAQAAAENPMLNSGPNQLGQVNYQSGVRPGYQQTPPGFHGTPTDINAYRPGMSVNNQGAANAGDSANPQTASGPFLAPEALTKSPTPLTPSAEPAAPKSTLAGRSTEAAPEKPKSKMFGSVDDDDYADDRDSYSSSSNKFAPPAAAPPNPAIKMVGVFAIVLLLGKLFAIISYMQTDWFKFQPFVIDQLVGLLTLICLAAICLLPRN